MLISGLTLLAAVNVAGAAIAEFYVGRDTLASLTSGTYVGQPNPNAGRLTLLFAHPDDANPSSNHYHGIGAWSYSGPAATPIVQSTNGNNRIPEIFSGQTPLPVRLGSGIYEGKLTTFHDEAVEYSDLRFVSTHSLSPFGETTPEGYLYNSSGGRWRGSLSGATVALELVNKSPALRIGTETSTDILVNVGDRFTLGAGESLQSPLVLWTETTAVLGDLFATFKLVDISAGVSPLPESGTFSFDVRVPEPSMLTAAIGAAMVLLRRR